MWAIKGTIEIAGNVSAQHICFHTQADTECEDPLTSADVVEMNASNIVAASDLINCPPDTQPSPHLFFGVSQGIFTLILILTYTNIINHLIVSPFDPVCFLFFLSVCL